MDLRPKAEPSSGLSGEAMMPIQFDFSESDPPWRVDIIDWTQVNESFRQAVSKDFTPFD